LLVVTISDDRHMGQTLGETTGSPDPTLSRRSRSRIFKPFPRRRGRSFAGSSHLDASLAALQMPVGRTADPTRLPRFATARRRGDSPVVFQKDTCHHPVANQKEQSMGEKRPRKDVQQGTLALMVLKTLDVLGPLHGYGIARRIEQISGDLLSVNQGTLYPLLLKLEHEGAISSEYGASDNNRRARFYRLTRSGRRQLETETRGWQQTTELIGRFLTVKAEDLP
jgi:transcriptional regulator